MIRKPGQVLSFLSFRNTNGRFPDRRTGFFDNGLVFVGALRLGNSPLDYPTSFLRISRAKAGPALKARNSLYKQITLMQTLAYFCRQPEVFPIL